MPRQKKTEELEPIAIELDEDGNEVLSNTLPKEQLEPGRVEFVPIPVPAPTAKAAPANKPATKGKRIKGKTLELTLAKTWHHVLHVNQKRRDKQSDQEILTFMKSEFPSKTLANLKVEVARKKYNNRYYGNIVRRSTSLEETINPKSRIGLNMKSAKENKYNGSKKRK